MQRKKEECRAIKTPLPFSLPLTHIQENKVLAQSRQDKPHFPLQQNNNKSLLRYEKGDHDDDEFAIDAFGDDDDADLVHQN